MWRSHWFVLSPVADYWRTLFLFLKITFINTSITLGKIDSNLNPPISTLGQCNSFRLYITLLTCLSRWSFILLSHTSARILRLPCKTNALFVKSEINVTLNIKAIADFTIKSVYECVKPCLMNRRCKTFSVHVILRRCRLYEHNSTDTGILLVPADGWELYQTNWKQKKVRGAFIYLIYYSVRGL